VGLDRASRAGILATVRRLVAEEGLSVLWATHLFEEVEPEDEVYVLHRGRVVAHGNALAVTAATGEARSLDEAFRTLTAEPETEAT
jgi:ABC-2 type transport system ATP-binding protein